MATTTDHSDLLATQEELKLRQVRQLNQALTDHLEEFVLRHAGEISALADGVEVTSMSVMCHLRAGLSDGRAVSLKTVEFQRDLAGGQDAS